MAMGLMGCLAMSAHGFTPAMPLALRRATGAVQSPVRARAQCEAKRCVNVRLSDTPHQGQARTHTLIWAFMATGGCLACAAKVTARLRTSLSP